MKPQTIEFRTLGTIELRSGAGREFDSVINQRKRLALLAYLSMSPRLHRRDSLLALLWPDLDETRARNAMRQAFHFLRSSLGEETFVRRGNDEVGIDEGTLWCDAAALDRAFDEGDLGAVADLYRGEFMEGFHVSKVATEFEDWLERERFRLHERAVDALRQLAGRAEDVGDLEAAVAWVRRAIGLSPQDERAHRKLIALLDRSGDRSAAIEAYETFAERMREELGVDPAVETQKLVEAVRERVSPFATSPAADAGIRIPSPPIPPTPLIGRRKEIELALHELDQEDVRLLTLTGTGGSGKTRLAIAIAAEVADQYRDGVGFISLAGIRRVEDVPGFVAEAMGVDESGTGSRGGDLVAALGNCRLLLILDNFEQILEAAPFVVSLLESAPGVDVLLTSRAPLEVRWERTLQVPPLSLPDPDRRLGAELPLDSEAVALFIDRVQAIDPSFRLRENNVEAVIEICGRLDGLPLAIELAAARMKTLSLAALVDRLSNLFDLLKTRTRDLPERQRTLEGTIRWSTDFLSAEERELFRGLSVFVGGIRLSAVEAVWETLPGATMTSVDGLESLVGMSLLRRLEDLGDDPRYAMLETVREFAARELAAKKKSSVWRRLHAEHLVEWVEEGQRHYCSEGQSEWMDTLSEEALNLRTALDWSISTGATETAARLAAGLWWFWWVRGHLTEGRSWIARVLEMDAGLTATLRAKLLTGAGGLAAAQGDRDEAVEKNEESVVVSREIGEKSGIASALQNLGFAYRERGDFDQARDAFEEALTLGRELGHDLRVAVALYSLGNLARLNGERDRAESLLRESLSLSRHVGDRGREARDLSELAELAVESGDTEGARELLERALRLYQMLDQRGQIAETLVRLADLVRERELERAVEWYARALEIHRQAEFMPGVAKVLARFSAVAMELGRPETAIRLLSGLEATVSEHDEDLEALFETISGWLGEERFDAGRSAGAGLSIDEMVRLAHDLVPTAEFRLRSS